MQLPEVPQRTTPGFVFADIERALSECLGRRAFGAAEKQQVLEFFGQPACVFCGAPNISRWDHLVAIRQGGETVLGNMVLACARCDNSKGQQPFEEWMRGAAPGSPASRGVADIEARIARLRAYVAHYGYLVRPLDQRLTAEERVLLGQIRAQLWAAQQETEALISRYRARTGHH